MTINVPSGIGTIRLGSWPSVFVGRGLYRLVGGIVVVVVVILTFPPCLKKLDPGGCEGEVLLASEAWTVTDTQPRKTVNVQKAGRRNPWVR